MGILRRIVGNFKSAFVRRPFLVRDFVLVVVLVLESGQTE
jgi:hypothetical protein